jgi:hypothetical protein
MKCPVSGHCIELHLCIFYKKILENEPGLAMSPTQYIFQAFEVTEDRKSLQCSPR